MAFADDIVVFGEASVQNARNILDIMELFNTRLASKSTFLNPFLCPEEF